MFIMYISLSHLHYLCYNLRNMCTWLLFICYRHLQ